MPPSEIQKAMHELEKRILGLEHAIGILAEVQHTQLLQTQGLQDLGRQVDRVSSTQQHQTETFARLFRQVEEIEKDNRFTLGELSRYILAAAFGALATYLAARWGMK